MKKVKQWYSTTSYVDIDSDSGEILTKVNAKKNYIKLKTIKHVQYIKKVVGYELQTHGYINYIHECTRNGTNAKLFETD